MIRTKAPNSKLDYSIDWTDWLGSGDSIATSTWDTPEGITVVEENSDASYATIWLEGGTLGESYEFNNTIISDRGRKESQSLVVVVNEDLLTPGVNSFGTYAEIATQIALGSMGTLIRQQKRSVQESILLQAWRNISLMSVSLTTTDGEDYNDIREMDPESYDKLPIAIINRLIRGQIIESDHLLGINPVEDRRRMGLLSDKAGESGHFFRTVKPLDMPIYRETARHLKGIIHYNVGVGRAG